MGAVSLALGAGSTFDFEGRVYHLAPWTFEVQGEFEKYLEREAVAACQRISTFLPADSAEKALSLLLRDIAAGIYTFGTDTVGKALESNKHSRYLVWLMFRAQPNQTDVTRELVDRMFKEKLKELMTAAKLANADPNETGPTEATKPPA